MPQGTISYLTSLFFILLMFCAGVRVHAQMPPTAASERKSPSIQQHSILDNTFSPEIDCENGLDDDNNGLADMKDFHCYFNSQSAMDDCISTKIIWASSNWGIHWIDLETNEQHVVSERTGETFDDITWAADGKLYGAERSGGIYQVDPYTYQRTFVGDVEGHYYTNGMTADANGWLYLSSFTPEGICNVVRFHPVTRKTEVIVSLSPYNVRSSGDMCFLNGFLYVACTYNAMAKIDVRTRTVQMQYLTNSPTADGTYGMTTLGDGYLYFSDNWSNIYRLDPTTLAVTFYSTINYSDLRVLGFTSYADLCNASACKGTVKITTERIPPYCAGNGVLLNAEGGGIKGSSGYTWTLPGADTVHGNSVNANSSGTYYVSYHTNPDTCSAVDSIVLDMVALPQVSLGKDTFVCKNGTLELRVKLNNDKNERFWDDGSTSLTRNVTQAGKYWVESINDCGITSDTIIVSERIADNVYLGNDTTMCKYDRIVLKNNLSIDGGATYTWSNGSHEHEIEVKEPGAYVLDINTYCGTISDTIVVNQKIDGCECFLHVPNAFTPNNDGSNDWFKVQSNCAIKGTLEVFNRWGGMVYTTSDITKGWNGNSGSNVQPSGSYVYHIRYEYVNRPGQYTKKGTLLLIH
jgi:gliding motility-associated-like protein